MENFFFVFIILCFVVQITFWIVTASSAKKTSKNKGGWLMRIIAIAVVLSVIFFREQIISFVPIMGIKFWSHSLVSGILADIVTLLGVMFMIWSRITLGKNWSANVTLKEGHELITSGPYAYVRHPIYSGLLLMILGLAIYAGSFLGFFVFLLFLFGARYKAHKEEKLLLEYFPQEYPAYKKKVWTLIPFVF
jgi:protein-S-isoprenylcysteine O-methyltransferase Ste14